MVTLTPVKVQQIMVALVVAVVVETGFPAGDGGSAGTGAFGPPSSGNDGSAGNGICFPTLVEGGDGGNQSGASIWWKWWKRWSIDNPQQIRVQRFISKQKRIWS